MTYTYEKYDDNDEIISCPQDDKDASITGKFVINVPRWFDENPDQRIALGWIKHLHPEIKDCVEYNPQTQFVVQSTQIVDEYTVTDAYHVLDKSEEQLAFEEMLSVASWGDNGGFTFF